MKNNNKASNDPFVFDKVGRVVAAIFFIMPGIVCIYKCFEYHNMWIILNCTLFIIFLAGIYSSYLRVRSCIVFYRLENNRCIWLAYTHIYLNENLNEKRYEKRSNVS